MQLKIKAVAASFFSEMQEIVGLYARGIQIFVLRYVDWNKIYYAYKSIVFIQFWHNYFFMFTKSDRSFLIN